MIQKLIGNLPKGIVFILSAPAGTGKTTLVRMLSKEFPCIIESISCTTRAPRAGEIEGKDYFFLSKDEFEKKVRSGNFLEYAHVFGYYYGTLRASVLEQLERGKHVFLVIDTQGAMLLKNNQFPGVYIFLSPPSLHELKERLVKRQTDSLATIDKRLDGAKAELEMISHYDYHLVNDNLDLAYEILRSIVIAEERRILK